MTRGLALVAALLCLVQVGSAFAAPSLPPADAATPTAPTWDVHGELGLRGLGAASFGTDDIGTRSGQTRWAQSRLIAGASWRTAGFGAELEVEALNGTFAGDGLHLGERYDSDLFLTPRDGRASAVQRVLPRKATLHFDTPIGRLLVGPQVFHWGLGLVAHDGRTPSAFGDPRQGNIVSRVAFATRPLQGARSKLLASLLVFAGADLVVRDDNSVLLDGDVALAALAGARVEHEGTALGAFVAARAQTDREDQHRPDGARAETRVVAIDGFARHAFATTAQRRVIGEAEIAGLLGESSRPYSDETLKGVAVRALGAVARGRLELDALGLDGQVEVGYASGDNDPRDATARAFAFHSDFNVGLVLFDQVLPAIAARSLDRLADPTLLSRPPPSLRYAVPQGAVSNAAYLQSSLRWRPTPALELRLGWLLAASAGSVVDPYQSGMRAGEPTTAGGQPATSGLYGQEWNASVRGLMALKGRLRLGLGAEAGILLPGAVFDGVQGLGRPWLGRLTCDVRY